MYFAQVYNIIFMYYKVIVVFVCLLGLLDDERVFAGFLSEEDVTRGYHVAVPYISNPYMHDHGSDQQRDSTQVCVCVRVCVCVCVSVSVCVCCMLVDGE